MFRAEFRWLANGLTLKMNGELVGDWPEQARRLITTEVVPTGLIVDLTEITYVDSAGERLLTWLGGLGAVFVAGSVYGMAVCEHLGLTRKQRPSATATRITEDKSSSKESHAV